MSLLRIRPPLAGTPLLWRWTLIQEGRAPLAGEGGIAHVPQGAKRVQLVLPAAEVLITRAQLPPAARRHAGSVLAYAVEEQTAGEPDANQVSWLGRSGGADVLAVTDKERLAFWLDALEAGGPGVPEVHCETLFLDWAAGEWSLAWDGCEGFVRSGALEGGATDCGDRDHPPLALRLRLEEAQARGEAPTSIAVHASTASAPDLDAWQRALGIPLRLAGTWDWGTAAAQAGVRLAQRQRRWRIPPGLLERLRPAAWIVGAALAVHGVALVADWGSLVRTQGALRDSMQARFRATFPDAIAVVDPALQMRRKLAEARHTAGRTDAGDFLPMFEQVASAAKDLPAGALRAVSYEAGRISLVLSAADEAGLRRLSSRLRATGLGVERTPGTSPAGATIVLTVRAT